MKRIFAIALTLIVAFAALTGCMNAQNPSEKAEQNSSEKAEQNSSEEARNSSESFSTITMTIAETLPSCVAFEYKDGNPYCFYAYDTEGELYRVLWTDFKGLNEKDVITVEYSDAVRALTYDVYPDGGWTPPYEVTAANVKMEKRANENHVGHIQISSGGNTIFPFSSLIWSKIDNQDGTFTESSAERHDIVDLVNGKGNFPVTDIPKLLLDGDVTYLVQVNGMVEKVYLLAPNGSGYTKSETTFEALSTLTSGTYYVALEVLLDGNCDPDAPQNSYRYEDVFCLVVK